MSEEEKHPSTGAVASRTQTPASASASAITTESSLTSPDEASNSSSMMEEDASSRTHSGQQSQQQQPCDAMDVNMAEELMFLTMSQISDDQLTAAFRQACHLCPELVTRETDSRWFLRYVDDILVCLYACASVCLCVPHQYRCGSDCRSIGGSLPATIRVSLANTYMVKLDVTKICCLSHHSQISRV